MNNSLPRKSALDVGARLALAGILLAVALKLSVIYVGAPFITVDDKTAFEAGFLVWFGNAPPQRTYIESWIYGFVSIGVYAWRSLTAGGGEGLGLELVPDAYADFYASPEPYVLAYRFFTLMADLATTGLLFLIARRTLGTKAGPGLAAVTAALYLLSYNALWSGVVSRPDSLLALYCALGAYLYLKSDHGVRTNYLYAAAVVLGMAAGQKLHGAILAILLSIDLLRVHGLRQGLPKALVLAIVSFAFFVIAAGTLLFDPLAYAKLRLSNYSDDYSPWIKWGDQVWTALRGTGWVALPLAFWGAFVTLRRDSPATRSADPAGKTIALVAVGALLLFLSIRQLRAYWMLPFLPFIYIAAIRALDSLRDVFRYGAIAVLSVILAGQSVVQAVELRRARYAELTGWIRDAAVAKPMYVLGYDALVLPKNAQCLERTHEIISSQLQRDRQERLGFTTRHLKNWEERSGLTLIEMLDGRDVAGFEYYDYYSAPPERLQSAVGFDRIQYFLLQDGFDLGTEPMVRDLIDRDFVLLGERTGAGGGPAGLKYRIFERKAH